MDADDENEEKAEENDENYGEDAMKMMIDVWKILVAG